VVSDERGQASILLVAGLAAILLGAVVLGAAERAAGRAGSAQRAADLAALAGARAMDADYARLFEPAVLDGRDNPRHLEVAEYLARARGIAMETARRNGAAGADGAAGAGDTGGVTVTFPDASSMAPVRVRVSVADRFDVRSGQAHRRLRLRATAVAELAPPGADGIPAFAAGSGYDGPLAYRQGRPMRPDVAQAFDRMERAAEADGVRLLITSALRTDAEQAALWAAHPDPKWVAPPGTSLHRYGTELDLGPAAAYPWLQAHAGQFRFIQRYANEPWHFGFTLNARSTRRGGDGAARRGLPAFVPGTFAAPIARAAQRWNVSGTLLAAQLYAESGFNPFARSPAGAQGIAQFMPGTAAGLGLDNPFDAAQAIDAQAHLMRDLLRRFAAVSLALAAYNAGPAPVAACGCIPPFAETRAYVARILGLMSGTGEPLVAGTGLAVRLVR
jgi:soluble lytic murein transglycosylase-like protein